jgi:hypothetical protein
MLAFTFTSLGVLAQSVRAPPCHGGGCGFEPRRLRSFYKEQPTEYKQLEPLRVVSRGYGVYVKVWGGVYCKLRVEVGC